MMLQDPKQVSSNILMETKELWIKPPEVGLWNLLLMATGLEKVSFILIPKQGIAKVCSNYCTIALILCSKSFKLGFSNT